MGSNANSSIENVKHYEHFSEVPKEVQKYWSQRYDIFSRYDEGIQLTDDAWYGVTPELIAEKIAEHIAKAAPAHKTVLIDAFAGAGGNTIAFAKSGRWDRVFAIESDPEVLECAKHNAAVYGVANKIWWIEGDCFSVLKKRFSGFGYSAVVFGSPPWGGPGYRSDEVFSLSLMQPYSLQMLHSAFSKVSKDVVLFLPRTSDLNELAELASDNSKLPVTHYCMRGASKALCAFFGDFDFD